MTKELLQQLLNALKFYADPTVYDADFMGRRHRITYVADSAIIAIEAAIALPVQPARCQYCDDTGDVHDATGEWRGTCTCSVGTSALLVEPAAQPIALPVKPAVDQWQKRHPFETDAEWLNSDEFDAKWWVTNKGWQIRALRDIAPPVEPVSDHFPFYELKFIMRVLDHKGQAPREDWETAYGMALAVFNDWHKITSKQEDAK